GTLCIGDIVTFDTLRWRGQVECLLYLFQGQLRFLAISQPLDALLFQYLLRILLDHLDEAQLLAAFGRGNRHAAFAFFAQPRLNDGPIIWLCFDDYLRWN